MKPQNLILGKNKPISLAVFLSGTGTNFKAILNEQKRLEDLGCKTYGRVDFVFSNVPGCKGAIIAEENGIKVISISSKDFFEKLGKPPGDEEGRILYDIKVSNLLENNCKPDLIILAGYRRRFSKIFFNKYKNRVINLYPGNTTDKSLIKGVPAVLQSIRNGEKEIRCSVYIQKENERFGPLIVQSEPISIKDFSEDTFEEAEKKVREEGEWIIFPYVVHKLIAKGRVSIDSNNSIYVDGIKTNQ